MARKSTTSTVAATITTTSTVTLDQLHRMTRGQLMALATANGLKVRDTLPKPVIVDRVAQHLVPGHEAGSVRESQAGKPAPLASSLPTKARVLAGLAAAPAGRAWHGAKPATIIAPEPPPVITGTIVNTNVLTGR